MKRLLFILLILPLVGLSQTQTTTSVYSLKAKQYIDAPLYKINGTSIDTSTSTIRWFTKHKMDMLTSAYNKQASQWTTSSSNIYFNTGSVGIGYASPSYTLHVKGGIDADSIFIGGAKVYADDPNRWADFNHNIYTDWGFVGINKNNPTHWLDVAGGINADTILINNIPVVSSQWSSSGNQIFYSNGMVSMNDSAQVGEYLDVEGDYFQTLLSNNSHFTIFEDNRSDTIFTINKNKGIRFDPNNLGYKVGIGKNPTAAFEVSGSTLFHTNNSYGFCVFDDVNDGTALSANAVNKTILIDDQSNGYKVGIGTNRPFSALQVNGSVQVGNDSESASADKVGAIRYRVSGNSSICEMCMQTGASTYAWVVIKQNTW